MEQATTISAANSRTTRGYAICLTGTVIWSLTAIFIRYITQNFSMPPLLLAFWRDLFVCITLGMACWLIKPELLRVPRREALFLAIYGLTLFLLNTTWTISVDLNGAALATVVVYSSPAISAVLGWRLFKEKLDRIKLLAIGLAIAGTILVSGAYDPSVWRLNLLGVITGLLSGVAFAAYSLVGKATSLRRINPWSAMLYGFTWATIFLLAANLIVPDASGAVTSRDFLWLGNAWLGWGALALLAIGPTIGGYGLYTVSLGYLPTSVANLIATLEPVLTAILAYILLSERFGTPQLMGGLLVIAGVVTLRIGEGNA